MLLNIRNRIQVLFGGSLDTRENGESDGGFDASSGLALIGRGNSWSPSSRKSPGPILLCFAIPLLLGYSSGLARAGGVSVDIHPYVNANLHNYTNGSHYPPGGTILTNGGISFTLADYGNTTDLGAIQTPSSPPASAFDIPVSIADPVVIYTLINSAYGEFGHTVGSVEFKATGGVDYSVNLVEGQDIRDHNNDGFNNTIGDGALGSLYIHTFSYGPVRLDEQEFVLPASFNTATLTDIILHGTGNYPNGEPFLAGATVQLSSLPEPASLLMMCLGIGTGLLLPRSRRVVRELEKIF